MAHIRNILYLFALLAFSSSAVAAPDGPVTRELKFEPIVDRRAKAEPIEEELGEESATENILIELEVSEATAEEGYDWKGLLSQFSKEAVINSLKAKATRHTNYRLYEAKCLFGEDCKVRARSTISSLIGGSLCDGAGLCYVRATAPIRMATEMGLYESGSWDVWVIEGNWWFDTHDRIVAISPHGEDEIAVVDEEESR